MSGLADLQATESQVGTDVTALKNVIGTMITDVKAALANDDSDAAVEAANQVLAQYDAELQQLGSQVQGADPGTPAAPPAASTPPATA